MKHIISRRDLLYSGGVLSVGALAGCSGLENGEETENQENRDDNNDNIQSPESPETTESQESPENIPSNTLSPLTTADNPQPPEPRFVVAEDGSADYETLEDAFRVAESGDVIELKRGSYEIEPNPEEDGNSIILTGAGRDQTTVTITSDKDRLTLDDETYEFWNITVETIDDLYLYINSSAELNAYFSRYRVPTKGWRANGDTIGGMYAYETTIAPPPLSDQDIQLSWAPVWLSSLRLEHCTVDSPIHFEGSITAIDTVFTETPHEADAGGRIHNSRLEAGLGLDAFSDGVAPLLVTDSELHPNEDGFAVSISSVSTETGSEGFQGPSIRRSEIYGKIEDIFYEDVYVRSERKWGALGYLVGNTIYGDEIDADYVIDGKGADYIIRNAFVGADVRIDAENVSVSNKATEVGNYYSSFDESDNDGDGIVDLPRPIPGDGELTDQYPLAGEDIDTFASETSPDGVIQFFRQNRDTAYRTPSLEDEFPVGQNRLETILSRLAERGILSNDDEYWVKS